MKPRRLTCAFATTLSLAFSLMPLAQAANTTFTLMPPSTSWSTDTWSSPIMGIGAGDVAQFNTAGTAVTVLDTDVTLGVLQTGTTAATLWNLTGVTNTFTLDGTGILAANQPFGNAGVAAISSRNTGGNLTVAPSIRLGATPLDIGSTSTGTVTLSGGITATAPQALNIRNNGTGGSTLSGSIGATGSSIAISNLGTSNGGTTISGALGPNVTSILQNSAGSVLTLTGANAGFTGSISVGLGQLNANSVGALGSASALTFNGGTSINAGVAGITLAGNPTLSIGGNWTVTGNTLNLGTGAVTLNGSNVGIITNTTNNTTFGGNISGSASLTKNAQSNGGFTNMGAIVLNGTNTYTGGTIIQQGQVQFGSAASVPATGKISLSPLATNSSNYQGAAAVFNFAVNQDELAKISPTSVGVVALGAASNNALDFSATGANLPSVSLGAQGNFTYSGSLTPWTNAAGGSYRLGGSGHANTGSTLTVSSALADAGAIATGLIVNPTFVGFAAGNVTLTGNSTYTGVTKVNTGILKLDFSGNAGSDVSNLISPSSSLALANFGTLNLTGKSGSTNSQTFNGLTLLGSNSTISATQNGAVGLTGNFGAITRNLHGTVTFSALPTTGGFMTSHSLDGSSNGGILGAWATIGTGAATRYTTQTGGNLAPYTSGTAAATAAALTDTTGLENYDLATAGALPAAASLNTIRYGGAVGSVDIGANNLSLSGVLNAGTGAFTVTSTSTGNVVIGATRELVINSANAATFINAPIMDNAAGASSLTITGNSGGQYAVLQKPSTYTGGTFINGNVALQAATNALGASTSPVTFNGGQLNAETNEITLANPLSFTQGTSTTLNPNSKNFTLTGPVTGTGTMFVGDGGSFASLILQGDMSGFGGTIIYNAGGNNGDNFAIGNASAGNNNLSRVTVIGENAGTRRFNTGGGYLQIGALQGSLTLISGGTIQAGALNTDSTFGGVTTSNNVAIVKVGTGTWTLNSSGGWGNNGGVSANNGTLEIDMGGLATPTNFLGVNGLTVNGGTLSILGKASTLQNSSQAFNGLTVRAGSSAIKVANNGGIGTVATLAGINRITTVGSVGGGSVDFVLPSGTQSGTNGITTTSSANQANGVVTQATTNFITYATVNGGTDWASLNGSAGTVNLVALGAVGSTGVYTTNAFTGNADWTTSQSPATGVASTLRFNTDGVVLTLTGTNEVTGGGVLTTPNAASSGATITGGTLTTGGGNEFVFATYGKLNVASQLINNGTTSLTKSGPGTLVLSNTGNSYSGINYLNDGVVDITTAGNLGTSTAADAISFNGGTLRFGAAAINLNTMGINLGYKGGVIDTNGFNSTYDGVVTSTLAVVGTTTENTGGQFGLTKAGAGKLRLGGINTYAGATTVAGGTLNVAGSLAAGSTVNVTTAGILEGAGVINGKVNGAGIIAPGDAGAGTLTTGAATVTGTLDIQINGAVGDKLMVNGDLTLSGATLAVALLPGGYSQPSYVIAEYTGTLKGTFGTVPSGYAVTYDAGVGNKQIVLTRIVGPYEIWAASKGLTGENDAANFDADDDGLSNVLEFVLGGEPLTGFNPVLPTSVVDGANVRFEFNRSDLSKGDPSIALKVQWSTDLVNWLPQNEITIPAESAGAVTVTDVPPDMDKVSVLIPRSNEANGKLFVRLKAIK